MRCIITEDGEKALIGGPDGVGGDYLSGNNYVDDHVPAHAVYGGNDIFYRTTNYPNVFIQVGRQWVCPSVSVWAVHYQIDRVTHICVSIQGQCILACHNGLSPVRHQAIIWTWNDLLSIELFGTHFYEIQIKIHQFSCKKINLKMPSTKLRRFCRGRIMLFIGSFTRLITQLTNQQISHSVYSNYQVHSWWRHQMETFPCYWPFVRGIHQSPVDFPHIGQWRGALIQKKTVAQTIETLMIWDAIVLIMTPP